MNSKKEVKVLLLYSHLIIVCIFLCNSMVFAQKFADVYVTVLNDKGQIIKGMGAENFRVFENDKPREIRFFSAESEPASVAIIFDLSASVTHNETDDTKSRVAWYRKSALDFVRLSRSDNEYTLFTFGEQIFNVAERVDPKKASELVGTDSLFVRPKKDGTTPLFVAVKSAIEKLQDSKLKRRVLILMTDGLDNASSKEVKVDVVATIKSALIPVFTLIAYDPTVRNMNLAELPPPRIASVSDESGGRYLER